MNNHVSKVTQNRKYCTDSMLQLKICSMQNQGFSFFLITGFNPVWYDILRFTIHTPELAILRFVVEDYDKTSKNDFVGQYTLPLSCMQQGMVETCW